MEWSGTEVRKPRLGVWRMALALVLAAFLGGALGLIWQSTGLGDDDETDSEVDSGVDSVVDSGADSAETSEPAE